MRPVRLLRIPLAGTLWISGNSLDIRLVRPPIGGARIEFNPSSNAYYQVESAPTVTGTWSIIGAILGTNALQGWSGPELQDLSCDKTDCA